MRNIYDYSLPELEEYFIITGNKKFRATQIYEYLYKKRVKTFEEMNNIGKNTIKDLNDNFSIERIKLIHKQVYVYHHK